MELAAELHIPLQEVLAWGPDMFWDWVAFFTIQADKRPKPRSMK